jgi:hypothetical protein
MPAKAGIHLFLLDWISACAEMTLEDFSQKLILAKVVVKMTQRKL